MTAGRAVADLADADFLREVDGPDGVAALTAGIGALRLGPDTTTIGCPSAWGRPRRGRLHQAVRAVCPSGRLVPRALLIAASHADAATSSVVVIEALLVPGECPGEHPDPWCAQLVSRAGPSWRIERSEAGELGTGTAGPGEIPAELTAFAGAAEVILVDGPGDGLTDALRSALPGARVACVDRALVERHGHRWLPPEPVDFAFPDPPIAPARRVPRAALAVAVAVLLAVLAAGLVARWPRPAAVAQPPLRTIGPAALEIPADWRRTELSGDRPDDGRGLRAVFADGTDGRRLIVVVTALRAGADRESVAQSLANRIAQRGDDVVVEFAAASSYGGRDVISYREAPESGPAVRWYVVVDGGLQVSVGCQDGNGAERIDAVCARAVGTARAHAPVSPR